MSEKTRAIVSGDGKMGREVNPYSEGFFFEKQAGVEHRFDDGQYEQFEATVKSYPLTQPMQPGLEIMVEKVWREHLVIDRHEIWRDCEIIGNEYLCKTGFEQKQFYKPIEEVKEDNEIHAVKFTSMQVKQLRALDDLICHEDDTEIRLALFEARKAYMIKLGYRFANSTIDKEEERGIMSMLNSKFSY